MMNKGRSSGQDNASREGVVAVRCGSGVLESGEHIRTDLPPCAREGDIIEKLREWATELRQFQFEVQLDGLLRKLNDLQEQSTGGEG